MTSEVTFDTELCGYCNRPLTGTARFEGHRSCMKQAKRMQAMTEQDNKTEAQKWLEEHPNWKGPGGVSLNEKRAMEQAAKEESNRQQKLDAVERKRHLSFLEGQVEVLRRQIKEDETRIDG
jgi:hypothetical protein